MSRCPCPACPTRTARGSNQLSCARGHAMRSKTGPALLLQLHASNAFQGFSRRRLATYTAGGSSSRALSNEPSLRRAGGVHRRALRRQQCGGVGAGRRRKNHRLHALRQPLAGRAPGLARNRDLLQRQPAHGDRAAAAEAGARRARARVHGALAGRQDVRRGDRGHDDAATAPVAAKAASCRRRTRCS